MCILIEEMFALADNMTRIQARITMCASCDLHWVLDF